MRSRRKSIALFSSGAVLGAGTLFWLWSRWGKEPPPTPFNIWQRILREEITADNIQQFYANAKNQYETTQNPVYKTVYAARIADLNNRAFDLGVNVED